MTKPKILMLSGSVRKDSYNNALIKIATEILNKYGVEAKYIALKDYEMPIYNGDDEASNGLPEKAKELKKLFIEYDGFCISSPEYNSSFSPLLKNAIDWMSRAETKDEPSLIAFTNKIASLMSASPGGLGGIRGLVHLRSMLQNINVITYPLQTCVANAATNLQNVESFTNSPYMKMLEKQMQGFASFAIKLTQ